MASTHIFPQSGDNDDAENFAQMIGHPNLNNYVSNGMGFSVDYGVPEVTIGTGVCYISQSSETTSSTAETRLQTGEVVQVDSATKSLTDSDVNHIYVEPGFGTDDNATYQVYTDTVSASSTALKIGEIDTSADTAVLFNRAPGATFSDTFQIIDSGDQSNVLAEISGTGPFEFHTEIQIDADTLLDFGGGAFDIQYVSGDTELSITETGVGEVIALQEGGDVDVQRRLHVNGANVVVDDDQRFDIGDGDYHLEYESSNTRLAMTETGVSDFMRVQDSGEIDVLRDVDLNNNNLADVATIDGGGDAVTFEDDVLLETGHSVVFPQDSGAEVIADMSVSSSPGAGTEESISIAVDATNILTVYAEADSSGGIQNTRLDVLNSDLRMNLDQDIEDENGTPRMEINTGATVLRAESTNPYVDLDGETHLELGVSSTENWIIRDVSNTHDAVRYLPSVAPGVFELTNAILELAGHDIEDGTTTIWDASNNWIPPGRLENDSITVNTGQDLTGGQTVALGGSMTIDHADTSTQGSVNNSGGSVIQDVTLDGRGHVTGLASTDLDTRYDDYSSWTFEEGDGESTTIASGERAIVSGGTDINTEMTNTAPATIEVRHDDTSSQGNVSPNSNQVIDVIDVDGRGHVTNMGISGRSLSSWNVPSYLDIRSADRFGLPTRTSDPAANVGDMWYRTDLD